MANLYYKIRNTVGDKIKAGGVFLIFIKLCGRYKGNYARKVRYYKKVLKLQYCN